VIKVSSVVVSVEEFEAFHARVVRLREVFQLNGRGTQQEAAYSCQVSPSRVSNLLQAKAVDTGLLALLEVWASRLPVQPELAVEVA
jgi:predicted DNA-binding protein (UPF0251 family)